MALVLDAAVSVQVPVNVPAPLLRNETVPVGVVGAVALVSVTTALQLVTSFATTDEGLQVTLVVVVCRTVTVASSFVLR